MKSYNYSIQLVLFFRTVVYGRSMNRSININNHSGRKFDIYWVHPDTDEKLKQSTSPIFAGATFNLNSYVSHAFEAIEVPNKNTNLCSGTKGICRSASFAVTDSDNQVINVLKNFSVQIEDDVSRAQKGANEISRFCEKTVLSSLDSDGDFDRASAKSTADEMMECVRSGMAEKFDFLKREMDFQASIRTSMADLIDRYACKDQSLNVTTPVTTDRWMSIDGKYRHVDVLVDRNYAKIHVVKDFISESECRAIKKQVDHRLYAGPDRTVKLGELKHNPGSKIGLRIFEYANHATGYDLGIEGQEDLMVIKYTGRGSGEARPDRYMPHCDEDCAGKQHKEGNRVATMVMYCDVPEAGGEANFRNSNVLLRPEKGSSIFFSYMGSDEIMDSGFTEHSDCPVIEGNKFIMMQWMRSGVDAAYPWYSFDTRGVQIMHEAENLNEKDEHSRDKYFGDHETAVDEGSDEL
eukprot:CAMPEP_0194281756 /NCGR_PEP_ID=MMETSP0169-20130528/21494_1 /TAXON_ID=218684 /ORGANISM="Corethron pennatum, Strain L29A3" /LENGTH=463 /DNA_ID=CAMNT_0039026903 /DNA_START=31 /DNA_END=1422 /DNA_ORIENTATION=+